MSSLNDLNTLTCAVNGGCGTGNGNWPKPGDPSNNSFLTATPVYGGIDIQWSFPDVNPQAVAHTRLYRALSPNFASAYLHSIVAGSLFFDKIVAETDLTYSYWIQIVSVNGTHGEVIGPASATARPIAEETLESLTGMIDEGVLAQSLKTEIDRIQINGQSIIDEANARFEANQSLANALSQVQGDIDGAITYINEEITNRVEGQDAILKRVNSLAVGNSDLASAIVNEQEARIEGDEALARDVTILYTKNSENAAGILAERTARISADSALASEQTTIKANVASNNAAIIAESTARANADSAMASRISAMEVASGNNSAAIKTEETARIKGDSALATRITNTETSWNGNLAQAEQRMESKVTTVDGKVNQIGALWTAKVSVNGLIGGFGVYNDGRTVEAGFDVDTFWVGRSANKVKPFIISNGNVHIDQARIRDADITTLKIAGNAVTVPVTQSSLSPVVGNGSTVGVITFLVTMNEPGYLYVASGGYITYGSGWTLAETWINVNNSSIATLAADEGLISAAMSGSVYVGAGTHTVQMLFRASNKATLQHATVFAMGVKR